jgi:hypothetical protein
MINKFSIVNIMRMFPKLTTGTLYTRTGGDTFSSGTAYAKIYEPPNMDATGFGGDGMPGTAGDIILFQMGESVAPFPDDKLTDANGNTWLIQTVESRHNFDSTHGVHRCHCVQLN